MLLNKLIKRQLSSSFILIQDDDHMSAHSLLYSFVKNYCDLEGKVHAFLYEHDPMEFRSLFKDHNSKFIIHDFYSDPKGWNQDDYNLVQNSLSEVCNGDYDNNAVVILDSLSSIIHHHSMQDCSWMLQRLIQRKSISTVIALFHVHLHPSHIAKVLAYQADTVLTITSERHKLSSNYAEKTPNRDVALCFITYQKVNGKVLTSEEEYTVNIKCFELSVKIWAPTKASESENSGIQPPSFDMTDVTFNLDLSQAEEAQRKKLIMPYTKLQTEENTSSGIGEIFYEPDEADLYEDDPDDDLDF